jgi:hypothetical protein
MENERINKHIPNIEGIVEEERLKDELRKLIWIKPSSLDDAKELWKQGEAIVDQLLQSQADQYEREKGELVREIRLNGVLDGNNEYVNMENIERVIRKYGVDLSE